MLSQIRHVFKNELNSEIKIEMIHQRQKRRAEKCVAMANCPEIVNPGLTDIKGQHIKKKKKVTFS